MALVTRVIFNNKIKLLTSSQNLLCVRYSQAADNKNTEQFDGEFRVLNLKSVKNQFQLKRKPKPVGAKPPRTNEMAENQDWPSVWPGPRSFHPASVPLPIRQGYNRKSKGAPPSKYGNAELIKIPNFLHLTPPAIQRHCQALSKFCTPWPENLDTEEKCRQHFPVKIFSSDYCHSSPSIRDPMARIVSLKIKLSDIPLDTHAKDKFRRLIGDRYDESTDDFTLVADRCPTRKQNYDYAMYLLTALFHESWTIEPWEAEKSEEDMEYYDWESSKSKEAVHSILTRGLKESEIQTLDLNQKSEVQQFKQAVNILRNEGENDINYTAYKTATLRLLNL